MVQIKLVVRAVGFMVISCSTSIATVDDLPPLPPLCNVHTGRRCKMTNGLLHPSVTVFALQSREKTLLADSKSRAFGSHRKSSKHNHLRHPPHHQRLRRSDYPQNKASYTCSIDRKRRYDSQIPKDYHETVPKAPQSHDVSHFPQYAIC